MARKKFSNDDLGSNRKGFRDLLLEVEVTVGDFNIGDFIRYLDWLDFLGMNRCMKEAKKIFNAFVEKVIDDHCMDSTLND